MLGRHRCGHGGARSWEAGQGSATVGIGGGPEAIARNNPNFPRALLVSNVTNASQAGNISVRMRS